MEVVGAQGLPPHGLVFIGSNPANNRGGSDLVSLDTGHRCLKRKKIDGEEQAGVVTVGRCEGSGPGVSVIGHLVRGLLIFSPPQPYRLSGSPMQRYTSISSSCTRTQTANRKPGGRDAVKQKKIMLNTVQ